MLQTKPRLQTTIFVFTVFQRELILFYYFILTGKESRKHLSMVEAMLLVAQ